jgi:peptide/nickel transport system substrate-binding protein
VTGRINRKLHAVAITLAALMLSSSPAPAQTAPQRGGTLNIGFASDSKTLDPTFSVQFTERQVLYLVFNTLVRFGPDFSIHPELAESWRVENEGRRVVFKLRRGVRFHDGTEFDANAVKWNIERRLDPKVNSPQREQLSPVIENVEPIDPHTVAFNLKSPFAGLLSLLGERPGFMISPPAAEKAGNDFGDRPVGTGPFVFREWVRGSHINLERNPNYWEEGKPYLDRIVFRDIAGSVVGIQRLLTGEIDFVPDLSPQDIKPIEGRPRIGLVPITIGRWFSLQWHWNTAPFNNAKLRHAIAHAIDRQRLVQIVTDGRGTVSDGPTPQGLWWYDASIKSDPYDPKKARDLLSEAGYPEGLDVVLSTPQIAVFNQINQLVQEQLAAVGVRATLQPASQSDWYARLVRRETNFSPTRWTQRPDPDGLLYILFHSQGFANTTGYSNPKVDELLSKARQTFDQDERTKLYSEVQRLVVADLPMLPLFFSVEYAAIRDNVHGFAWIPDQIPRFRDLWKTSR